MIQGRMDQKDRSTPPHLQELMKFLDVLNAESERGAVLISLSMLDEQLRQTLQAFLLDHPRAKPLLEGFNAPLGTLSAAPWRRFQWASYPTASMRTWT